MAQEPDHIRTEAERAVWARLVRVYDALERRDAEAIVVLCSEDVEVYTLRSTLEGPYLGHDGLRRMTADLERDWTTLHIEPRGAQFASARLVLVPTRLSLGGRASGAILDRDTAIVWALGADGLVTYSRLHTDSAQAREDFRARAATPE